LAALVAVLGRCVTAEEAYRLIEWRLIILIGGMTSLGVAMTETGAAELVASWVAQATAPLGPYAVMTAFIVLTMLLTQALSNAAAALVVVPVAVSTALQVGMEPRTLAVVVALSASLSFITPLEPACLLVYSPGKYRFMDFVRVGVPLSLLAMVVLLGLVPIFWPM
jgi:di/tricarboxylate transporter